ncbi:MAG: phosphatidate cytidylyltransferase [Planctomycetota bacterium]|nr:phosphatidate cytidylyltransferase [Planctomycetota bacterium]
MLRWRLLLGAIFIAALAALCYFDATTQRGDTAPGIYLFPLALLLSLLASGEMLRFLRAVKMAPSAALVYLGNLAIVASNGIPLYGSSLGIELADPAALGRLGWPLITLTLSVLVLFAIEMIRYQKPGQSTLNLAGGAISLLYVGVLLSFVVQLRAIDLAGYDGARSIIPLVSLIAIVKIGDIGAYTLGRLFGRHKMTPTLSPGKTWEGAGGALLFASITALVIGYFWSGTADNAASIGRWIIYGLLIGATGIVGDLAESLLKRDTGFKDSSSWMPGFGGILDLLDSILFTAPVAYLCWVMGLVG